MKRRDSSQKRQLSERHRANLVSLGYLYPVASFDAWPNSQVYRAFKLAGACTTLGATRMQGVDILRLLMSGAVPVRKPWRRKSA